MGKMLRYNAKESKLEEFKFDFKNWLGENLEGNEGELGAHSMYYCCGISEIRSFTENSFDSLYRDFKYNWFHQIDQDKKLGENYNSKSTKLPTKTYFKKEVFDYYSGILQGYTKQVQHVYFVSLVDSQIWLKPMLTKSGFRLVSDRTTNGKGGARLYIFLLDRVCKKGRVVTKKSRRF